MATDPDIPEWVWQAAHELSDAIADTEWRPARPLVDFHDLEENTGKSYGYLFEIYTRADAPHPSLFGSEELIGPDAITPLPTDLLEWVGDQRSRVYQAEIADEFRPSRVRLRMLLADRETRERLRERDRRREKQALERFTA